MKRYFKVFISLAVLALAAAPAFSQQITKFGVVDTAKVYNAYFRNSAPVRNYEKKKAEFQEEINKQVEAIKKLQQKKLDYENAGNETQALKTEAEITKKTDAQVESFFDVYGVPYDECYAYFLKHHGNDYIKDDYWFLLKNEAGDTEQYMVDMLFGLQKCSGNIMNEMKEWEDVVQDDLVCIADRPGGDLVCMDKEDGSIWFWFHDVADDNLVMVADSFEEFICGFSYEELATATCATIGGPTTAAALAINKGWGDLVVPGILVGLYGYITGNYFGVLVGDLLM